MSSSPALPAAATKRALLVGIDAYQFVSGLEGCVNDARLMQRLLVDTFGFPSASVTLLTDAGATRDGILAALDALVAATGTDDVVVVYYAGHGSQMTDRSGLKASGMDSTLLPVDSGRDWTAQGGENHPNRDITDDEINARLAALADRTRFTTVIVDACHSGTITRDAVGPTFGVRSRGIAPDTRPASELPPAPAVARGRGDGGPLPSGWAPLADRYVLIAGCRDDERSYEYRAPGDGGTVTHGALTYFLAQALAAPVPNTTYRDVFERAAAQVTAANGEQHPQLEGRTDREVLGVRDVAPARFVRVLAADGDHVTLGIGAALGAAPGARYDVHAQGTKDPTTATPLATAEIVTVSAVTSEARLLSGAGAVAADARAFPTTAPDPDRRLRVQLVVAAGAADPDGQAGTLRAALGASPLVALVDDDQPAAVRVYLIGARAAAAPGDPVPQLGAVAGPTWAIVGDDGQLLAPVKPAAVTDDVRQNVETIARYRQALALTNPDPASGLAGRFSLDLLRQNADGTWAVAAPDGGLVAYEEGDRIGFRVTSRHDAPVYLNLVDFGLTGRVALVYPPTGAADTLAPGVTFDLLGQRPANRGWPVTWPAGLPFEGGPGTADGVETVKLFAATGPADFSFLTQAAVRDATRGSRRPTALELLMRTATGAPTRDIGDDAPAAPTSDWTTVDRAFVVRRRRSAPLPAGGAPVTVGATTLRAPALVGEVTATAGPRPTVAPAGAVSSVTATDVADPLAQALGASGATVRQTIAVAATPTNTTRDAVAADRAAGGARAPAAVDVTVADPGPGFGQLLVNTDALGVVSFHFATDVDGAGTDGAAAGTRWALAPGAPAGTPGTRTFRVTVPVAVAPDDGAAANGLAPGDGTAAARGLVLPGVVKFVLKEVVFPLVDPLIGAVSERYAAAWEAKHRPYHVRPFGPADYTADTATSIDGDGWQRLAAGRALLFVHGTFSRAHSAFGGLPAAVMGALATQYGGRVFAFDHYTLSEDPEDNVRWLIAQIPDGTALDLDIVCHSRGGLVSRILAERQGTLTMGGRSVRVEKVVFVGAPNAGTTLADTDHMGALIDTYATLLNLIPEPTAKEVLEGVVTVAKQLAVGAAKGLPGLQSMCPGGPFAKGLNAGARDGAARYFALTSDYAPRAAGLKALLAHRLMDGIFSGPNDLVVPTAGVWDANGSGFFPIEDRRVFGGAESCAHTEFFGSAAAQSQLLGWLRAD